ncbi:MAG: helix-turn-helix domain-containing protein [Chloroflexota bacterium]|nr:helix-turn-helix domain-containing protein [Chloroflexota bacterium]
MVITSPVSERHTAPGEPERAAYSIEEAATMLGISRTSAYLAAQRGEIPSRLIGRRRVVPKVALDRFLSGDDTLPISIEPRRPGVA